MYLQMIPLFDIDQSGLLFSSKLFVLVSRVSGLLLVTMQMSGEVLFIPLVVQ